MVMILYTPAVDDHRTIKTLNKIAAVSYANLPSAIRESTDGWIHTGRGGRISYFPFYIFPKTKFKFCIYVEPKTTILLQWQS